MKNKVLIITEKDDVHADEFIRRFSVTKPFPVEIIRLSIEDFSTNILASFDGTDYNVKITDSGRCFSTNEIKSVWYRKPNQIKVEHDDNGVKSFIREEYLVFIQGLYACTCDSALWVNDRRKMLFASNKMYQLKIAKQIGFNVPAVIISNDADSVIDYLKNSTFEICNKGLSKPTYSINGKEKLFYTKKLQRERIVENITSINVCPTLLEEYIDKKYDIRVTIIGDDIFACEIHSQDNPLSKEDFRTVSPDAIDHQPHNLPEEIMEKIRAYMRHMGLSFSAMDFVLDKHDTYWFIENNPNGQWLWMEYVSEIKMMDSMIRLLCG